MNNVCLLSYVVRVAVSDPQGSPCLTLKGLRSQPLRVIVPNP